MIIGSEWEPVEGFAGFTLISQFLVTEGEPSVGLSASFGACAASPGASNDFVATFDAGVLFNLAHSSSTSTVEASVLASAFLSSLLCRARIESQLLAFSQYPKGIESLRFNNQTLLVSLMTKPNQKR